MDRLDIVDAHHHLWDLNRNHYPWLADEAVLDFPAGDYSALKRDYMPDDYRRDAARQNVVKTVHIEAEWSRDDQVGETRWLSEISRTHGFPDAVVAHAWMDRDDSEEVLAGHARFPNVRGIRSKPVTAPAPDAIEPGAPGTMGDAKWRTGFALLEKFGFSYDLRVPYWHLEEAADLARDFPGTQFILNHAGLPWDRSDEGLAIWRKGMEAVAAHDNVAAKISFLVVKTRPWTPEDQRQVVLDTIRIFGVERCMFASNYPVDGLFAGFDTLFNAYKAFVADLPRADQEKLFSLNAMRFYRLDP